MRRAQIALERLLSGYLKATYFLFFCSYSALVVSQELPSEISLDNIDGTSELRQLHVSGDLSARASVTLDTGDLVQLNLVYVDPFADGRRVWLDGKPLDPRQYGSERRYYRGSVLGDPLSYAFLSVQPSGEGSLYLDYAGSQYRATVSDRGLDLTVGQRVSMAPSAGGWPETDVVEGPELEPPSGPKAKQLSASATVETEARSESIAVPEGWYGPWTLTVPSGQSFVGAVNRGPGIAATYIVPRGTDPWTVTYCEASKCFIQNPDAGNYDVWVYKFDSKSLIDAPDLATSVNFGYGSALSGSQLYTATLAIELDEALYSAMGSSPAAVDTYLAELVSYVSATYEQEVSTRLLVGDVVLYSSDPYANTSNTHTRLYDVMDYWRENYSGVRRALTVHLGRYETFRGGVARLDQLCDDSSGYSVSGVYGNAPTDASQLNWDAVVLAHELGHNFASEHTHCYNGLEGNSNPVDACYNGEAGRGCWAGSESLPGIGSLTGGTQGAQNGTIMSYCHVRSSGLSNISRTFGANTSYGIEPERVPTRMARRTAQIAAASSECLSITHHSRNIGRRTWGSTINCD